jgi:hypothetical protein
MISRACREAAKYTSFVPSELGPRKAATGEELRSAREKMHPNLMPKNGPQSVRISERKNREQIQASFPTVDIGTQFQDE